jgi:chorismate mutase
LKRYNNMTIDTLRSQIDSIDDEIINLLKNRVKIVKQVGELKRENSASQSFIRAGREASMLRQLIKKADGIFPPAAIATMWRMVISASLSVEQEVVIHSFAGSDNSCFWLAREYFGTFQAVQLEKNVEELIEKVSANPAAVGVLPLLDNSKNPWWVRPQNETNNIYVFARIPFIAENQSLVPPVLAIANTSPETTGEDISLFSITSNIRKENIAEAFKSHSLEARILSSSNNNFLVEVEKFIPAGDKVINDINESLGKGSTTRLMGSYAVPVLTI